MIKLKNKIQEFLSLIPKDKLLHYFYGSILTFIFATFFEIFVVILLVLTISIIKELTVIPNKASLSAKNLAYCKIADFPEAIIGEGPISRSL